jgi:carbonic anhydrase
LRTHPTVAAALAAGKIELHGWVYHIATGEVTAFDAEQDKFVAL